MIPYKSPFLVAVPQNWQVRLEIMTAIRTLAKQSEDDQVRQRRADIAALRRSCEQLALSVYDLWRECEPRARSYVIKYSPEQPRVPAGNSDGGQWTSEGQSGPSSDSTGDSEATPGDISNSGTQYAALDTGTRTDATADESGVQVAAGPGRPGYSIDLLEEEQLGGHTVAQHVGKSEDYLLSLISDDEMAAQRHGDLAEGLREGSFPSLEAANKLVNSTVAENQDQVDLVTSGVSPREQLDAEFGSPTGYEAYARTERSTPYIRDTFGVRVIIVPDRNSPKGYRVDTAFPINF